MFTENEVAALVAQPAIQAETARLKQAFCAREAEFLEISDHDFLSLILVSPRVGIALANGSIDFKEEQSLNKMARKFSKGGYMFSKDPVVRAMSLFIKAFAHWEQPFQAHLRLVIDTVLDGSQLTGTGKAGDATSDDQFAIHVLQAPFLYVRMLSTFFVADESEDFVAQRNVLAEELAYMKGLGDALSLSGTPLFEAFLARFSAK